MKLFYGEKIVGKNEHLTNNKNLIHKGKRLLVLSESDFSEVRLDAREKLIFWGKIYAVIKEDGTFKQIDFSEDGDSVIKKIFDKSNLNDFIRKIEGNFVGCFIDKNDDVVVFGNSFNQKDVFYSFQDGGIAASTNLSSLISDGKKSYDQAALANLLSIYGMYAPKKQTIYQGIKRLGVGERLSIKNTNIQIEKTPFSPVKIEDFENSKLDEYSDLLDEAVRIRGSKKCNWLYLSSGWDSTALLALLVKNFGISKVKAVIGKMLYSDNARDANRFEIERAKKVADYYSVDLEVVPMDYTTNDGVKSWQKIIPFLRDNHIYADNSCNFYFLSDYIRKNASLEDSVFCGEISDGVHNFGFSQSMTILEHPVQEFREYSDKMATYLFGPTFYKTILDGTYSEDAVYKLLRSRASDDLFDDETELTEYEKKSKFVSSLFIRNKRIPFYSVHNLQSLTEDGAEMYESVMFDSYLKECVDNLEPDNLYSWILHLYNSFHWQGSTVKSIFEVTHFNNLDLSMPFWDKRLHEFLSKMPENWGRGLEMRPTKYPLKWMLENKIDYPTHLQVGPHSYLYDVDPNFSLKAELLYRSALRDYFEKTLKDYPFEQILEKKYFNLDYYRKLTDDFIEGNEIRGQQLNDLYHLVFLCWIGWY